MKKIVMVISVAALLSVGANAQKMMPLVHNLG